MRKTHLLFPIAVTAFCAACGSESAGEDGDSQSSGAGGESASGGSSHSGGTNSASGGSGVTATGGTSGVGGSAATGGTSGVGGSAASGDVVWIDTPIIEHTRDYFPLSEYVNPDVPSNWREPVNYADGDMTIRIELVEIADPAAVPIYYLVGWDAADGSDRYIRGGARFDESSGVQEFRVRVKDFQKVENGVDAGSVEDDWDWTRAFAQPNADTWGSGGPPYPLKARVRLTLHPKL